MHCAHEDGKLGLRAGPDNQHLQALAEADSWAEVRQLLADGGEADE
jgi:hypothetical protein